MSRSRLVVLLVLGLAVLVLMRAAPAAVAGFAGLRERVEVRRTLLAGIRGEMRALPALEDSAASLRAGVGELAPRLLAGQSEAAAAADLSARLGSIAVQRHGRLLRLEVLPDSTTAGRLRRLRARAVLETDFRGVAELLSTLGRQALILVPERVVISQAGSLEPSEASERLQVELELTGWYLAGPT